jgi:hypothetical protein
MGKRVLIAVGAVLGVVLVVGMFLPHEYRLQRTRTIRADRARIHELTNHLARWKEWAWWEQGNATMRRYLTGKARGVGATQTWISDVDDGRVLITKSDPDVGVEYDIVFVKEGHESLSRGAMTYAPRGEATEVTWTFDGVMDVPVVGGWMARFAGSTVGPKMDEGLSAIAAKVEAR